jgi:predicted Rossmann-fold nucleotide-binding protein
MTKYDDEIKQYLEKLATQGVKKIIAFSGGADDNLENKVLKIVEDSIFEFRGLPIAVLTGGTVWGLPKYASEIAKKNNIPVIGIYPQRGVKYALKNLDFALEVSPRYGPSEWGDESELFAKLANGVEVIGGGAGTLIEFAHILKANEAKIKSGGPFTYIAPIKLNGVKTTSDIIYDFPMKSENRAAFPPQEIVEDGRYAANFLIEKLGIRD